MKINVLATTSLAPLLLSLLLGTAMATSPASLNLRQDGQVRELQECKEPDVSAFQIPSFDFAPGLPPYHQLHISLFETHAVTLRKHETPISIRLSSYVDILVWNCIASFHPTWNSALATPSSGEDISTEPAKQVPENDFPLVRSLNSDSHTTDARLMCALYANAYATPGLYNEDPEATETFLQGLPAIVLGLEAEDIAIPSSLIESCPDATDTTCLEEYAVCHGYAPDAMGAIVAHQVISFAKDDGWNSDGALTKNGRSCTANCRPYQDASSYDPADVANATGCRDIQVGDSDACWVPLKEDFGKGYFTFQEHVTPYIGPNAKPRVLETVQDRTVPTPVYDYAAELDTVLDRVGSITEQQKMMIELGDDKIQFNVVIIFNALMKYGPVQLSFEKVAFWALSLTSADYDAVLTVWNEKVRHNLIRPPTVAQRLDPEGTTNTYVNGFLEAQEIARADFQPYIRTMPHAEYPSGSSCIFQTIEEMVIDAFTYLLPGVFEVDDFAIAWEFPAGSSKIEPGMTPAEDLTIAFPNIRELIFAASESRIDGGMHFSEAVPAGKDLCRGIGNIAVDWVKSLVNNQDMIEDFPLPPPPESPVDDTPMDPDDGDDEDELDTTILPDEEVADPNPESPPDDSAAFSLAGSAVLLAVPVLLAHI